MAVESGKDGAVYQGAGPTKILDITGWTLDREIATGAYTSSDTAGITKRVTGFTDATGTFDFVGDGEDDASVPAIGADVALQLRSDGVTGQRGWKFTSVIIKSISITVTVDENPIAGSAVFEANSAPAELP